MTNDQIKTELVTLVKEWREIADATQSAAEAHIKRGEKGNGDVQSAFAYSRRSCAQMLENKVKEIFGSTIAEDPASMPPLN